MLRTHLNSRQARGYRNAAIVLFLLVFGSCQQQTLEPTQPNNRTIRIETVNPNGYPVKDVEITITEDQGANAPTDGHGFTGTDGAVGLPLAIPTFGHNYAFDIREKTPVFDEPLYPVFLKCQDTTLRFVVPDNNPVIVVDTLCGGSDDRTLTFYACPDSSVTVTYVLKNCGGAAYTLNPPTGLQPPFSISPMPPVPVGANPGSATLTITYDAKGQTHDVSDIVTFTTTPPSNGTLTLRLIGHINYNCVQPPSPSILCGQDQQSHSEDFGSVCQNDTVGPQCVALVNGDNKAVTVTLPPQPPPFWYAVTKSGVLQSGNGFTLQQGESMTVCSWVSPTTPGVTKKTLVFQMQCPAGPLFSYTVPLSVNDTICNKCDCIDPYSSPNNPVAIGPHILVGSDTTFTTLVFHNDRNCPVTITQPTDDNPTDWTINYFSLNPPTPVSSWPVTVAAGGSLDLNIRFAPKKAGGSSDHVKYTITSPGPPPKTCKGELDLSGNGCHDACATIAMPSPQWRSKNTGWPDTLYLTQGGADTMFVSPALPASPTTSDPNICITIKMPDTACNKKTFQISGPTDHNHFSVSTTPDPMTLSPGDSGTICITFQVPTLSEVEQKYGGKANAEMKWTDAIQIADPGCGVKIIPIKALVDTVPPCDNFTLADYGVTGTDKTTYYQSWAFKTRSIAPYKSGDLYYSSGSLYSVDGQPRLLVWNEGPLANGLCTDKQQVLKDFNAFKPSLVGFSTSVSVSAGEIVIYAVPSGGYAVLQLGTPATSPQHGVEFLFSDYLYPMP